MLPPRFSVYGAGLCVNVPKARPKTRAQVRPHKAPPPTQKNRGGVKNRKTPVGDGVLDVPSHALQLTFFEFLPIYYKDNDINNPQDYLFAHLR